MAGSDASEDRYADGSWMRWTAFGLAAVWLGDVAMSILAPDLVSGSQQEHLPLAALHTWIWGLIASIGLLWGMAKLRGSAARQRTWTGLAIAVALIWLGAVVLAVLLPVWETGSDPTRLPIGAIVAPIGAALLTVLASVTAAVFAQSPS